jgi:hypothetical protein
MGLFLWLLLYVLNNSAGELHMYIILFLFFWLYFLYIAIWASQCIHQKDINKFKI